MKIIKPSVEIMRTGLESFVTPEQFIEKVGRTCYKSEDKITDDSAAKFVANLVKRGHEAMIEHYNLIFKTTAEWYQQIKYDRDILMTNCNIHTTELLRAYMRFTVNRTEDGEVRHIISGNLRAWRDFVKACVQGFGEVPQYMHGIIRCYHLFFPEFQDQLPEEIDNTILIPIYEYELVPGKERDTHMNVTMNLDGWRHFFELRCATSAHPDMREVAVMAQCELIDVLGEED